MKTPVSRRTAAFLALLIGSCILLLIPQKTQAAGYWFGTQESIHKIQDTNIKSAKGEALDLAHKVSSFYLFLGLSVHDDGYVLQVRGTGDSYYRLTAEKIASYQAEGLLPTPLPTYSVPFRDYVLGYGFWVVLGVGLVAQVWGRVREARNQPASSPAWIHQFRLGGSIAGVSLLVLIITIQLRGPIVDIVLVFAAVGVLGGVIVVLFSKRPEMASGSHVKPSVEGSSQPHSDGGLLVMIYIGFAANIFGLGAAIYWGSWVILGVVVGLMIVQWWALFSGFSGRAILALHAIILLAFFAVALYVGAQKERNRVYFSFTPGRDQKMLDARKWLFAAPQRALQLYDEVLQSNPDLEEAYLNRGIANARLGQTERAIQDFDAAIRLNPKDAYAYDYRGDAYRKLGQSQRAISDYDEAIKLSPASSHYYEHRAKAYEALGNAEQAQRDLALAKKAEAIVDYDRAINLIESQSPSQRFHPRNAAAYIDRGNAYDDLGQFWRAIEDFDQAIRLDATSAAAYYNRAIAYNKLDEKEMAIRDYSEVIRLRPEYSAAYRNRGNLHKDLGQTQQAIEDYAAAIRINPKEADAYFERAFVYNDLGERDRAIQDYSEAIRLDPKDWAAYNNRGLVYRALGKMNEAQRDFDQAKELKAKK